MTLTNMICYLVAFIILLGGMCLSGLPIYALFTDKDIPVIAGVFIFLIGLLVILISINIYIAI